MRTLSIDIETYSDVEIAKSGVYAYADSPAFEVLLFAYAFDDAPVQITDLARGETLPSEVKAALTDATVLKTAFNAQFERVCLSRMLGIKLDPAEWQCTAVRSAMLGLPGNLGEAGAALGIPEDQQKMAIGKALIRYFCMPCKPTKTNDGRTRNLPEHDEDRWELFKEYCLRDVEAERAIAHKLNAYQDLRFESALYALDQRIADRGVKVDAELIGNAVLFSDRKTQELSERAIAITGLSNPNSAAQLKGWLQGEDAALECETLRKADVPELIRKTDSEPVRTMLGLRQMMSKTSVKKYEAMRRALCRDGKVHGLLQFYGANRTGRWAGRLVQVQNLPRNQMRSLASARELVKRGEYEAFDLIYENVPDTLSQLVRTAFVPSSGCFAVADFSAIEARVIAWLAGEQWRLDVFKTHGKIYEASAAQMFHIPMDKVDKELRAKGKVAELALGYNGGAGALEKMGALKMGLDVSELTEIVSAWRTASPHIVRLWKDVERAVKKALAGKPQQLPHGLRFFTENDALLIRLPSGRCIAYYQPRLSPNTYGGDAISYMGVEQTARKWQRLTTYGGKLVENIVQATARDCLAVFLQRLDEDGYQTVFHVHDEAIVDGIQKPEADLDRILERMSQSIPWAQGLPLRGEGFTTEYYKKD